MRENKTSILNLNVETAHVVEEKTRKILYLSTFSSFRD